MGDTDSAIELVKGTSNARLHAFQATSPVAQCALVSELRAETSGAGTLDFVDKVISSRKSWQAFEALGLAAVLAISIDAANSANAKSLVVQSVDLDPVIGS